MNETSDKKIKTCFIGFGKRTKLFYAPILKRLNNNFDLCAFTKRSQSQVQEIKDEYEIAFSESTDVLLKEFDPDLLVISVPSAEVINVLQKIKNPNCVVFVDTPFYWPTEQLEISNILVSEQWPFLPIEQFKKLLIDSGELGEVFYAENESRTFEYHGIAQLRNYFKPDKQINKITGSSLNRPEESWEFGLLRYTDGTGFLYKFSYFVKKCLFRTHQALKTYLTQGSIISGCLHEKGNDYEILKISSNLDGEILHQNAEVKRSDAEITNRETSFHSGTNYNELESVSCRFGEREVIWKNPFVSLGFNDQEIAIATLLTNARNFILNGEQLIYPTKRATEDFLIFNEIRTGE
jgi:hypothetical protein